MRGSLRHRRRSGFTLVELMVGLAAGIVLLSSSWLLLSTSSEGFYRESRVATTQTAIRLAAEQLRRDLLRADFLGHPNTAGISDCGQAISGDTTVQALDLKQGTAPSGTNYSRFDTLQLSGNYVTGDRYGVDKSDGAQTIFLDRTTESFRRTFHGLESATHNEAAFAAVFAPGRRVRVDVYSPARHVAFRRIISANATDATVQLDSPLPSGRCGAQKLMPNSYITPISVIDYRVLDPHTDARFANFVRDDAANGSKLTSVLVRQEFDVAKDAPIAGSERSVLDYAVEFRLQALVCENAEPCTGAQLKVADPSAVTNPEQIQGLRVFLAARTPEIDPKLAHRPRTSFSTPLLTWNPVAAGDGQGKGTARVRSTVFEVAMPNNQ